MIACKWNASLHHPQAWKVHHKYHDLLVGTMGEKSLHDAIKQWIARPDDQLEAEVDGYVIDIVRGDLLIEIQTGNFSALKSKLESLTEHHAVRVVHPISEQKWIVRVAADGETVLSRRRSPKRGRVEELFYELVYMPELLRSPNLSLEVLLIRSEEVLIHDGRGSWRRRGWSIHDRRLLEVVDRVVFSKPSDLLVLLPKALPKQFTVKDLAEALKLRPSNAQKMAYTLRHMGAISVTGKRGRALLYSREE